MPTRISYFILHNRFHRYSTTLDNTINEHKQTIISHLLIVHRFFSLHRIEFNSIHSLSAAFTIEKNDTYTIDFVGQHLWFKCCCQRSDWLSVFACMRPCVHVCTISHYLLIFTLHGMSMKSTLMFAFVLSNRCKHSRTLGIMVGNDIGIIARRFRNGLYWRNFAKICAIFTMWSKWNFIMLSKQQKYNRVKFPTNIKCIAFISTIHRTPLIIRHWTDRHVWCK